MGEAAKESFAQRLSLFIHLYEISTSFDLLKHSLGQST